MKKLNPFAAFILGNMFFGTFVNCVDSIGGTVGDSGSGSGGSDEDFGIGDTSDTGDTDEGEKKGTDEGEKKGTDEGDKGTSKEGKAAGKESAVDYSSKFSALDSKINTLLSTLKGSSSGNDRKGDDGALDLEHDDLVTMLTEDPEGFINKLTAAVEGKVTDKVLRETANTALNEKIEATINDYADKNPDFEAMWDDGQIKDYMTKNPGHNAISAHMEITMEAKLAEAKKAGAEEAIKNFRTKSGNQVLNGGLGIPPSQRDAALKDPSKFGGRAAVLAARAGIK